MPSVPAITLFTLLLILSGSASASDVQTYRLDPVHTQIVFFADHLGLSKGIGRLKIDQGWFRFDPDDWGRSRVDLTIDLASLDMGDPKWNDAVRSAQFLDIARWPKARFTSDSVEHTADDTGIIRGHLQLRDIRQPLDLHITFNRIRNDPYSFRTKAGFSATARISRFDFGMQRYRDVVGESVELRIEVEGIRDPKAIQEQTPHAAEKH